MLSFPDHPAYFYGDSDHHYYSERLALDDAMSKPESDITKIAVTCLKDYDNVDIINSTKLLEMCEQLADQSNWLTLRNIVGLLLIFIVFLYESFSFTQ